MANGLCIGCGLCEAVAAKVSMTETAEGSLRPAPVDAFRAAEETALLVACPGVVAERRDGDGVELDEIWGSFLSMRYGWAGEPAVRFRAATGGVLTALGMHLLATDTAAFVLHVGAVPGRGAHSRWVMSETPQDVLLNTGARYGPTAPLAGLVVALERGEPFAVVAKPCDLGTIHRFARVDPRVKELCVARLAMVCGGQSRRSKTLHLLRQFGVAEDDVSVVRYRGYGNPGPTRVETHDGRAFETSYVELWEDESTWDLEPRCLLCPDALGETADVVALDVWPGGAPTGEDAGFNGLVVRTAVGAGLVESAERAGRLVLGDELTPRILDDMQPHQVRKKERLATRYAALTEAGKPTPDTIGLRVEELDRRLDDATRANEREGALRRVAAGRWSS